MLLLVTVGLVLVGLQSSLAAPVKSAEMELAAHNYLTRFGYLLPSNSEISDMIHPEHAQEEFVAALKRFQKFANLEVTGELDEETVKLMASPRCGVSDNQGPIPEFNLRDKWSKKHLTYKLGESTAKLPRAAVDDAIAKALQLWSESADLTFEKTDGAADIEIFFASRSHGDGSPFDGFEGVLAHAYFPQGGIIGGDAHFDEDETWTLGSAGIDILQVAAHEFGHSLGLAHSGHEDALMAPYYRSNLPVVTLHADDVAGIRAHYGPAKTDV